MLNWKVLNASDLRLIEQFKVNLIACEASLRANLSELRLKKNSIRGVEIKIFEIENASTS